MPKNNKLGTGLEAIFGNDVLDVLDEIQNNASADGSNRKVMININDIMVNPYQMRKDFDEVKLNELAQSISQHGVFTPVLVRKVGDSYQLITGERRLRASRIAGLTEIPAIIMDLDDLQVSEVTLLENIQRSDLNAIEEASGYRALIQQHGYTQEDLARRIGKSREHIANSMRLLRLPEEIQKMVSDHRLSMGHVRPLITLESEARMLEIAHKAIDQQLSVRQVEQLVKAKPTVKKKKAEDPQLKDLQKQLQQKFSTKVTLSDSAITIAYDGTADLNRILEILGIIE
ncbi:MAG: ParB/RepB/Spo0J family partition protein [Erysipelotrichaceae bacterium]|nr:ParB/RepB/Spo0J family partition protein [Erysipelotrichaceae bacterium]